MPDTNTPSKGAAHKPSSATAGTISLKNSSQKSQQSNDRNDGPSQVTPPPISPAITNTDDPQTTLTNTQIPAKPATTRQSNQPSASTASNQPTTPFAGSNRGTQQTQPPPDDNYNDDYDDFDDGFGGPGGFGGGLGGDFGGGGMYGDNFGFNSRNPYPNTGRPPYNPSSKPARLTPEERVKMIEKVYDEILCRKPDTRDINYYKYSTLSEEEIRKQLINSAEHKDMVKKGREYTAMKDRSEQLETRVRILEGQIKDQVEEFRELSNLLKEKNQYISELRTAANAHPGLQLNQLTQERPLHPDHYDVPVTPSPQTINHDLTTETPTTRSSDASAPKSAVPDVKISPEVPPMMSDPFEKKMRQIKHIFTDTLQNPPIPPSDSSQASPDEIKKKPSTKGFLGKFFQTPKP